MQLYFDSFLCRYVLKRVHVMLTTASHSVTAHSEFIKANNKFMIVHILRSCLYSDGAYTPIVSIYTQMVPILWSCLYSDRAYSPIVHIFWSCLYSDRAFTPIVHILRSCLYIFRSCLYSDRAYTPIVPILRSCLYSDPAVRSRTQSSVLEVKRVLDRESSVMTWGELELVAVRAFPRTLRTQGKPVNRVQYNNTTGTT